MRKDAEIARSKSRVSRSGRRWAVSIEESKAFHRGVRISREIAEE